MGLIFIDEIFNLFMESGGEGNSRLFWYPGTVYRYLFLTE